MNCDGGGLCVGGPAGVLAAVRRLDGGDEQRGGGARGGLAAVAARRRGRQHGDPASRRRVVDGLECGGEGSYIKFAMQVLQMKHGILFVESRELQKTAITGSLNKQYFSSVC